LGMGVLLTGDVPPFLMIATDADVQGRPRGINSEGLKRRGFSPERIAAIKRAYKTLYVAKLPFEETRAELARAAQEAPDVARMLEFIERGQRSLMR
ncbi:MAG: acyl-ACP--UDP-N-acetylglucosamine O-acyltransferase, partial [Rudaea sp.]